MPSSSNRHGKAKTYEPKTTTEEIALCKAWCEAMENYTTGDMRTGFWFNVFENFKKEMGETIRKYDTVIVKWKNSIRPKNALAEFQNGYEHPFTIEACWRILKNHEAWTEVKMTAYQRHDEREICHGYLTKKEHQQLLFDEEALRETLEEEAEKERAKAEKK
nr:hypothetical protein [Tanacetum cinerariifolium]